MECAPERLPHTEVGNDGYPYLILLFACKCGNEEHQWQGSMKVADVERVQ